MQKRIALFPGQGAQKTGMGKDLYDAFPKAREIFERACEASGQDLIKLSFEGPQEELNQTHICQPAILTTSIAFLEIIKQESKQKYLSCFAVAGLSLGEYSALVAAEVLSFENAVYLVSQRGRFMMEACKLKPSSMASIIGLNREECEAICLEASALGIICVANINSPTQMAVSGEIEPLEKAQELAKNKGAKAIPLAVSGAFHSLCMAPAGENLGKEIDKVAFNRAKFPVVSNVSGQYNIEPDQIRLSLKKQLVSPVEWVKSMELLMDEGVEQMAEIGPGKVLTGLLRGIRDGKAQGFPVNSISTLEKALGEGYFRAD